MKPSLDVMGNTFHNLNMQSVYNINMYKICIYAFKNVALSMTFCYLLISRTKKKISSLICYSSFIYYQNMITKNTEGYL